jgi:hypothetical protein
MLGGYLILLIMVLNFKIFQNQTIAGSDSFNNLKHPIGFNERTGGFLGS